MPLDTSISIARHFVDEEADGGDAKRSGSPCSLPTSEVQAADATSRRSTGIVERERKSHMGAGRGRHR